tara:strand:- start:2246 stop:2941 length:696 start_codon:yes stop_codon:yes gene_type:complete
MKTALITGSNKGLGLEYVKQLLKQSYQVIATCRSPNAATELNNIASTNPQLTVMPLDMTLDSDIQSLKSKINTQTIDLLVLNAGIRGEENVKIGQPINRDNLLSVMNTNTYGPIKLVESLFDNLKSSKSPILAVATSRVASIKDNTSGGCYAYRASKAALNAIMHSFAIDVQDMGIKVLLLHPGWVRTTITRRNGLIDPPESVKGMLNIIFNHQDYPSGSFIHYQGYTLPW